MKITKEELIKKLDDYPSTNKRLVSLNRRLSEIVSLRDTYDEALPKAQIISDMPRSGVVADGAYSALMDVENVLKRYAKDINDLTTQILAIMDEKEKIDRILFNLSLNDRCIIEYRHFEGRTWEWMSPKVYVTREWLPKVHNKILDKMIEMWNS